MVRALDVDTQAAIRDRRAVVPRNFILVGPVTPIGGGTPKTFGFTDFGEDVVTNVVDGLTGETVSRTFSGDSRPILSLDSMPLRLGVEIDNVRVTLSHLHPDVVDLVRAYDCRNAAVQIHRGWLSPDSMLLVAAPRCRRLGQVNGTPIETPAAGSAGSVVLTIVSRSRELTRTNPAKASQEFYARRSADKWGQYTGTAGQWSIWWGEEKADR